MRIAIITCKAYMDAWAPFMLLFNKFWNDCPYPPELCYEDFPGENWCSVVERVARNSEEPILMMQEDHFLSAPVDEYAIGHALRLVYGGAGCVRLYPCPGHDKEIGDPYFGLVAKGTPARISCQAAIWNPKFLGSIAVNSQSTTGEAGDFENLGTAYANELPQTVLAFKRELKPWPMNYICSAITRGKWNPDAIRLCDANGIAIDLSHRLIDGVWDGIQACN